MTRSLLLAPAVVAATAAAGLGLCAVAGWTAHAQALAAAGIVACLASIVAIIPMLLARHAAAAAAMQAGLAGTVLHLMAFLFLSLLAWALNLTGKVDAYAAWLLLFYAVSIVPVARIIIRFIRSAPPESPSPQPRAP